MHRACYACCLFGRLSLSTQSYVILVRVEPGDHGILVARCECSCPAPRTMSLGLASLIFRWLQAPFNECIRFFQLNVMRAISNAL